MSNKIELTRVTFEYSNGKKYVLEAEELEIFKNIHDIGIVCLKVHDFMADLEKYQKLMEKILSRVGGNDS